MTAAAAELAAPGAPVQRAGRGGRGVQGLGTLTAAAPAVAAGAVGPARSRERRGRRARGLASCRNAQRKPKHCLRAARCAPHYEPSRRRLARGASAGGHCTSAVREGTRA